MKNYSRVMNVIFIKCITISAILIASIPEIESNPQFRSPQNEEFYNKPYNRPSTSRPNKGYPVPNFRQPSYRYPADPNYQDPYKTNYHRTDNVRYGGHEYRTNERGVPGYGTRERDRLRFNFNQYIQENPDYEFKNTIFERWRPDLQGEKRPGETPGVNLPLAEDVFVSTDSGKIQGFYVYLYDQPGARFDEIPANKPLELQRHVLNLTVFLGIPYAQPPYDEGRFKPPRRVRNWHTTWQAIDYSPACPQNLKYIGATRGIRKGIEEDCLYLNVFSPSLSVNARERYPVMFYIHGGDFDHGAGSQFPAHMLSAWGEVVVVTINYRLGPLGFLSTGDYHSPGNYGLMDMALALEWVNDNIRFFNGDRERITVFGPGAGGAAAGLLAVLPRTMDWVHQVIAESGSPLADWAAIDDPYRVQNTSRVFGLEMGCNVENSYNLLRCLINRDYEELASAPITPDVGTFPWSPVVDGNFTVPGDSWFEEWNEEDWHILPELPIKLYQNNHHHRYLKYMTGVNRDEAANFVYNDIRLSKNNYVVTEDFFNERIKDWVKHYNYTLNPEGAFDAIKWKYTFWPDPHNTTHIREQYINMLSDALYKSSVDEIVKVLINSTNKESVPTYYYLLNTTVEALKLPLWREVPNNIEYYFVSGAPFMDPDFYPERIRVGRQQWTEGDRNISQFMMKTFANFAKWGNPTVEQVKPIKVNWELTTEESLKYLSINNTFNTTMHYNYRQTEATFWYQYMPLVVREYVPTPPPPRNPWIDMKEPVTATMYALLAVVVCFLVILCVCFGLWKSAKRQRNKALDDLSFYSTENLTLTKDEDYEVRSYLEKLSGLRQQNGGPSRSETLNTVLSGDQTIQSSRPITPNGGMLTNGKTASSNHTQGSISEPDNYSQNSLKKPLSSKSIPQQFNYNSLPKNSSAIHDKAVIMELEEPSRVIKGHGSGVKKENFRRESEQINGTSSEVGGDSQCKLYNEQHLGMPELPPYTDTPSNKISDANPLGGQPVYAQPHKSLPTQQGETRVTNSIHTSQPYTYTPPYVYSQPGEARVSNPGQIAQPYTYTPEYAYSQPLENGAPNHCYMSKASQPSAYTPEYTYSQPGEMRLINPNQTSVQPHYESPLPVSVSQPTEMQNGHSENETDFSQRPITPGGSSVTFEIQMKPSKSVGTISNASGLILNTDL